MKPPPQMQGGGGRHKRSGSLLFSPGSVIQTRQPPQDPPLPTDDQSFLLRSLRTLWWSHRRTGGRLPAERGIILIDGGKP